MLHQPRGQMAQGQASDIAIKAREVLVNRKNALQMLSAATGQSEERLRADTNRCLYLDAQQAVDYGIVDKIIDKRQAVGVDSLAEDVAAVSRGLG